MSSYEKISHNVSIAIVTAAITDIIVTEQGIAPEAKEIWKCWVKTVIAISNLVDSLKDASDEAKNSMIKKLEDLIK